jgi:TrmH family RNA methyltransferase
MPSRNEKKLLRALRRRKGRVEHGLFLAEGPRLVGELLATGTAPIKVLYTQVALTDPEAGPLLARLRAEGVESESLSRRELEEFADTVNPQGVLAVAEIPRWDWHDVGSPRILVLDAGPPPARRCGSR